MLAIGLVGGPDEHSAQTPSHTAVTFSVEGPMSIQPKPHHTRWRARCEFSPNPITHGGGPDEHSAQTPSHTVEGPMSLERQPHHTRWRAPWALSPNPITQAQGNNSVVWSEARIWAHSPHQKHELWTGLGHEESSRRRLRGKSTAKNIGQHESAVKAQHKDQNRFRPPVFLFPRIVPHPFCVVPILGYCFHPDFSFRPQLGCN